MRGKKLPELCGERTFLHAFFHPFLLHFIIQKCFRRSFASKYTIVEDKRFFVHGVRGKSHGVSCVFSPHPCKKCNLNHQPRRPAGPTKQAGKARRGCPARFGVCGSERPYKRNTIPGGCPARFGVFGKLIPVGTDSVRSSRSDTDTLYSEKRNRLPPCNIPRCRRGRPLPPAERIPPAQKAPVRLFC